MSRKIGKISLQRFIVSYVGVFIVPTLVIILLVQINFIHALTDAQLVSLAGAAESVRNSVDRELEKYEEITGYLQLDSEIDRHYSPNRYSEVLTLFSTLNQLSLNTNYLDKAFLYCMGDDYIFSATSSCRLEDFPFVYNIDSVKNREELLDIFSAASRNSSIRISKTSSESRILIYPIINTRGKTEKVVLFQIRDSAFHSTLKPALINNVGMAFISDTSGELISCFSNDIRLSEADTVPVLQALETTDTSSAVSSVNVRLNGKTYSCVSVLSGKRDYRYTVIVGDGVISNHIRDLYKMWAVIIAVSLVLGIIAALLVSEVNYRPIRNLRDKAGSVAEPLVSGDDYNYIYSSIEQLQSQNTLLRSSINDANEYIAFKLFKGEIHNMEELNQLRKMLGISVYGSVFRVALFRVKTISNFRTMIRDALPQPASFLLRQSAEDGLAAVVLVYPERSEELNAVFMENLRQVGADVSFGYAYPEIRYIPISYMQAYLMLGQEGITCFTSKAQGEESWNKLYKCMTHEEPVRDILATVRERIRSGETTLPEAKLEYLQLACTAAKSFEERGEDPPRFSDLFTVLQIDNLEQMSALIDQMISQLSPEEDIDRDVMQQMITWLKNHHSDIGFSLQQMAYEFGITVPALNAFFKDNTGKSVVEYISDMKIDMAKELLVSSSLSVHDIGLELGYYGQNSFIRRFKQQTGQTPGEYRKENT